MTQKIVIIALIGIFVTSCQTTHVFSLSGIPEAYIGKKDGEKWVYSADFKNSLDAVASKFGRKYYSAIYSDKGLIVTCSCRRMKKVESFIDALTPK